MPKANANDKEGEDNGDKKLIPYCKQIPVLSNDNFVEFKDALENLIYYADWHEATIDIKLSVNAPWNGNEEADKKRQSARKLAYAVLRLKLDTSSNTCSLASGQVTLEVGGGESTTAFAPRPLVPFSH